MDWKNVPKNWLDRCSGDGHERYVDENGDRRYKDNNKMEQHLKRIADAMEKFLKEGR